MWAYRILPPPLSLACFDERYTVPTWRIVFYNITAFLFIFYFNSLYFYFYLTLLSLFFLALAIRVTTTGIDGLEDRFGRVVTWISRGGVADSKKRWLHPLVGFGNL